MLIDIEQNIANLERTLSSAPHSSAPESRVSRLLKRASSVDKSPTVEKTDRKRSSTLRSVRNLMRLGKQRPPKDTDDEDEENVSLIKAAESGCNSRHPSESESAPLSRAGSQSSLSSNAESQASVSLVEKGRKASRYLFIHEISNNYYALRRKKNLLNSVSQLET